MNEKPRRIAANYVKYLKYVHRRIRLPRHLTKAEKFHSKKLETTSSVVVNINHGYLCEFLIPINYINSDHRF